LPTINCVSSSVGEIVGAHHEAVLVAAVVADLDDTVFVMPGSPVPGRTKRKWMSPDAKAGISPRASRPTMVFGGETSSKVITWTTATPALTPGKPKTIPSVSSCVVSTEAALFGTPDTFVDAGSESKSITAARPVWGAAVAMITAAPRAAVASASGRLGCRVICCPLPDAIAPPVIGGA
jgi:hypothetical protein